MTTPAPAQWAQARDVVRKALESQGARPRSAAIAALTVHLMEGGKPETYGERFAQMQLQLSGLLPEAQE